VCVCVGVCIEVCLEVVVCVSQGVGVQEGWVCLWMDLVSEEQHVEGILAAYPYMIKTPAGVHVCARAVS
jgi:hypothetical protein